MVAPEGGNPLRSGRWTDPVDRLPDRPATGSRAGSRTGSPTGPEIDLMTEEAGTSAV